MYQYTCSALLILLLATQVVAICNHVNNQELLEYSCEGGSVDDLKLIPSNTEKIRISNMSVGRISENLFSRFGSNLVSLSCSHCLISDINDNAFRRLDNLQQLSLDNNYLMEVRADWFEGLVYLTFLDLNYNGIEHIDSDVFRNAPSIVDLRLSGNRLVCLDLESMSRLDELKRIFLNDNPSFGCPNAMKMFLNERHVEFEADAHWSTVKVDRISAGEPLPQVPPTFVAPPNISSSTTIIMPQSTPPNTSPRSSPKTPPFTQPNSPPSSWSSSPSSSWSTSSSSSWTSSPSSSPSFSPNWESTPTSSWSTNTLTSNLPQKTPIIYENNPSLSKDQASISVPENTQQRQLNNYRSIAAEQMERNKSIHITTTTMTMRSTECPNVASRFSRNSSLFIVMILTATFFILEWIFD